MELSSEQFLTVVPLHETPEHLHECCRLINEEWKRSETARLRSLESSSDSLPTSLVLLQSDRVIGHAKLSRIPSLGDSCFVETVVIDKKLRGRGLGTFLMNEVENYCKKKLQLRSIYLSTKGQEGFYSRLGYEECQPVSIYGGGTTRVFVDYIKNSTPVFCNSRAPKPPPQPQNDSFVLQPRKTFMNKTL